MARRLRRGPAGGRPARTLDRGRGGRAGRGRAARGARRAVRPRAGVQLVVWALVLTVFGGLALLTSQGEGIRSRGETSRASAPAVSSAPVTSSAAGAPGASVSVVPAEAAEGARLLARPDDGADGADDECGRYNERRNFLPIHRWTHFNLFVVDNATIFKTQLFVSMIASLMFMAAALCWRIIASLLGFGYTFDMICRAADPINTTALACAKYASWFLIPAWLFVLAAVFRRMWGRGGGRGAASAARLLAAFLVASGMIFFIAQESEKGENGDSMQPYTVPWMTKEVQSWFNVIAKSLEGLHELAWEEGESAIFYDHREDVVGSVNCAKLDRTLYEIYTSENQNSNLGEGTQALTSLSRMWEISFVRSYQVAQFGEGTEQYPSPAHASCRWFEDNAGVPTSDKLKAFDRSAGLDDGSTKENMARGYFVSPAADEQSIMVAWGACKWNGSGDGTTIPQWSEADIEDANEACKKLFSTDEWSEDDRDRVEGTNLGIICFLCKDAAVGPFYFNGDDELKEKLGDCYTSNPACRADWNFVAAWLGKNQGERLTQGLLSLIVGIVFLFVMGPMAVGMTITEVALAGLVMALPLTMLLLSMNLQQGKRLLRLTGAAAAGHFLFTLGITFLMLLTDLSFKAITATIGSDTPNFFEQVAQGMAPLVALWLFRRLSRILGLGNISTTTGALGFSTAMMLKASGDPALSHNPGALMSRKLGNVGVGKARLSALDEKSLQRRAVNNPATRWAARKAGGALGRGLKRATRPVTDWTKDKAGAGRARLAQMGMNLRRKAASGTPGQRAAAYGGAFAGLAGLTMVAPPAVIATLPLMAATGAAAAGRGAQAGVGALRAAANGKGNGLALAGAGAGTSGLQSGSAAGIPMAKSARAGLREADNWHRNIIRVTNAGDRAALIEEHTRNGLDMLRARQWGNLQADGINRNFGGFVNDDEKMRALTEMANATGLKPDQLMIGNHGLVLPVPATIDWRNGQRRFEPGTTIEQASHPVHYLDRHTLQRRVVDGQVETDDQYIARLTAQLRERGYITDDGRVVDVFAAHGFDTRHPEVRERVERFIAGGRDDELANIVITPRRSEDVAVRVSREWAEVDLPPMEMRNARHMEAVGGVMHSARQEISDVMSNPVSLPDGRQGTVAELKGELQQQMSRMVDLLEGMQQLHRSAKSGNTDNGDLAAMVRAQQNCAAAVDRIAAELRDAVDASSSARSLTELRMKLADPRSSMDADEIWRLADEYTKRADKEKKDWHEAIDRLVGAICRRPDNDKDAEAIFDALADLEALFNKRLNRERKENEKVLQSLDDVMASVENSRRMTQYDPRAAAHQVENIRHTLMKMFSEERKPPARTSSGSDNDTTMVSDAEETRRA